MTVATQGSMAPPRAKELLRLLRYRHWTKNSFVVAPLFFTPAALSWETGVTIALGVFAFCLISSGTYIINDIIDREADRAHPGKRNRPLAAGTVGLGGAAVLAFAVFLAGFSLALWLPGTFGAFALGYVALNMAYSFGLRRVAIIDVLVVALGFVIRVFSGAALISVTPSPWIISCAGLLALFIALAKRRDDIEKGVDSNHRHSLKGYNLSFLDTTIAVVLGALMVAYLIYTTDGDVTSRLGTDRLYLTIPFVVVGILRYLQITLVEKRSGSPTRLILEDRPLQAAVFGWLLIFGYLIY